MGKNPADTGLSLHSGDVCVPVHRHHQRDKNLGGQKDKTQQLFSTSFLSGVHIADLRACLGAQSSLGLATHSAPADTDSPAQPSRLYWGPAAFRPFSGSYHEKEWSVGRCCSSHVAPALRVLQISALCSSKLLCCSSSCPVPMTHTRAAPGPVSYRRVQPSSPAASVQIVHL